MKEDIMEQHGLWTMMNFLSTLVTFRMFDNDVNLPKLMPKRSMFPMLACI